MRATRQMPRLEDLRIFDSCVSLGRIVHSSVTESITADTITAVMDRYGIRDALVHEHHARVVHPRERAERLLLEQIKGMPRLHPVRVVEPPGQPGPDAARAAVEAMLQAGVRAARLPMKAIPPLPWLWDDLCTVLEEHRVPCFLDFGVVNTMGAVGDGDVNGVREIATAHPDLPIVFSGLFGGQGVHPAIVPLMKRVPNVHIDIAGILEYWREAARDAGPERVLFSTHMPFADPGIYISNVQYARGLDEKEKRMICGDNLRRLLEDVR